jgi:hypothetical protein
MFLTARDQVPDRVRGVCPGRCASGKFIAPSSATGQTMSLRRVHRLAQGAAAPGPVILKCAD